MWLKLRHLTGKWMSEACMFARTPLRFTTEWLQTADLFASSAIISTLLKKWQIWHKIWCSASLEKADNLVMWSMKTMPRSSMIFLLLAYDGPYLFKRPVSILIKFLGILLCRYLSFQLHDVLNLSNVMGKVFQFLHSSLPPFISPSTAPLQAANIHSRFTHRSPRDTSLHHLPHPLCPHQNFQIFLWSSG